MENSFTSAIICEWSTRFWCSALIEWKVQHLEDNYIFDKGKYNLIIYTCHVIFDFIHNFVQKLFQYSTKISVILEGNNLYGSNTLILPWRHFSLSTYYKVWFKNFSTFYIEKCFGILKRLNFLSFWRLNMYLFELLHSYNPLLCIKCLSICYLSVCVSVKLRTFCFFSFLLWHPCQWLPHRLTEIYLSTTTSSQNAFMNVFLSYTFCVFRIMLHLLSHCKIC